MNTMPFQFDQRIDPDTLYSLYENDYLYIEEIFKTTLKHYDTDVEAFESCYSGENLEGLKRIAHKMKPVFGFIGMLDVQECCNDFEDKCTKTGDIKEIISDYEKLLRQFREVKKIIEADLQKLSEYNKNTE